MSTTVFKDDFAKEIWQSTYKDYKDTDIDSTFRRVAKAIASVENTVEKQQEWEEKFFDLLTDFKGTCGGRTYANAGTEFTGTTLLNCFVSPRGNYDIDSLDKIIDDVKNQALTLKSEGGYGQDFSFLRPRGAFISGIGVETPGAVKYMELYDKVSEIITSGSGKKSKNKKAKGKIRKGAMMSVVSVWHPDIIEFITAKQQQGRLTKFNMSVNCTDDFMEKVIKLQENYDEELDKWDLVFPDTNHEKYKEEWDGNIKKWTSKGYPVVVYNTVSVKYLWNLIMESTYNRAEPGVLFLDRANDLNPLYYGEHIAATNPSMPAGTLIHTKNGIFPIEQLENKSFQVKSLDGVWSDANCFLSGENEELIELEFGKFKNVRSTPKHKWPVLDVKTNTVKNIQTSELKVGDLIPLNRNEEIGINGEMNLTWNEGFFIGYFLGDGWFTKRKDTSGYNCGVTFGSTERDMADKVIGIVNSLKKNESTLSTRTRDNLTDELCFQFSDNTLISELINKYKLNPSEKTIPESVWKGNDEYIKGFVDGLLSSDGYVSGNVNRGEIGFISSRKDLAVGFAKLLSFAGVNSSIFHKTTSNVKFPNGKVYDKTYDSYRVKIIGHNVLRFNKIFTISHTDKKVKLANLVAHNEKTLRKVNNIDYIKIKNITQSNSEKVWDISVYHDQHVFPTEWSYTGNCGEQVLAPGGVCCLGSINLTQFVKDSEFDYEKIAKYVNYMVRFLDNVNEYSNAPLPEYVDSMRNKRRIGIGLMGWGSALFMLETRFGSEKAGILRDKLMQTISKSAYESSIDLAIEKGMFTYCDPVKHSEGKFVKSLGLSEDYMNKLRTTGIRNSSLLSIQPTGNSSIFANVVSGGLEPIFMPEYIRTVIIPNMIEEIADKTPKWYEGEWYETDLFKFTKEGDEDILKGIYNGTVYKIDRNRGLLKEVVCKDYGVRYLEENGKWNPNADYAVTALTGLTAEDHLNDLVGFTKYIDSAASKTINLPNEYTFDDFKDIYLTAYKTGYIKGITTYRSGTMATVLSSKETVDNGYDEEIILDNVKMTNSTDATMKVLKAEGRKWYLTVVYNESKTRPFALFVHTNHHEKSVTTHDGVDRLLELAEEKKIPQQFIDSVKEKIDNDNNATKITRVISLLLRHGVAIKNIVNVLSKVDNVYVGTFLFQITKYLATFIKDGEKVVDEKCLECGSTTIIYQEGCKKCITCGSSKCG